MVLTDAHGNGENRGTPFSNVTHARESDRGFVSLSGDLKKLRIHSGIVSRLIKEHSYYMKDSEKLISQIEEMKVRRHDIIVVLFSSVGSALCARYQTSIRGLC